MAITLSSLFTDNLLKPTGVSVSDALAGGTLKVYTGTPPAGPNEAATGTLLATWTFSSPAISGTPAGGIGNLSFTSLSATAAAGTASYFRIADSAGNALIQGTVGTSGADWNITSVTWAAGDTVTINAGPTISWPVA